VTRFGTHHWTGAKYCLENVCAGLSTPPQQQTSPNIVKGAAFGAFGICVVESETISQLVGNRLHMDSAVDDRHPVPFLSDVSLLL
jgi:hypothetical protein